MFKLQILRIKEEAGRCLLCYEPKCSAACPHGIDAGRIIQSLNFENRVGARRLPDVHYCVDLRRSLCRRLPPRKAGCTGAD